MILITNFSTQNIYFEEAEEALHYWIGKLKSYIPSEIKDSPVKNLKCLYTMRFRPWVYNVKGLDYLNSKTNDPIDIFQYIKKEYLEKLQNDKDFMLIHDDSMEGYSHYMYYFIHRFYFNCKKYNISPKKILFISSNLTIEESLKRYNEINQIPESINVWSYPFFELTFSNISKEKNYTIDQAKFDFKHSFNNKLFSSLSRLNRDWRSIGTYILSQSNIADKGLISHGPTTKQYRSNLESKLISHDPEFDNKKFKRWVKQLPAVVDVTNFSINQAGNLNSNIHDQTLFQIVNETLVEDWGHTSLFYSEKTYKPILHLQPFLIWGQRGCNRYLEDMGYKLYTDWFDYSFDDEPNHFLRYKKLLQSVEQAVKEIEKLKPEDYTNWRFKNTDVLEHNLRILQEHPFIKKKLYNLHDILLSHIR
jgi:hypothetical protein